MAVECGAGIGVWRGFSIEASGCLGRRLSVVIQGAWMEHILVVFPAGHVHIHQIEKALIVRRFKQVYQLMHQHILKALPWFFGEFRIES